MGYIRHDAVIAIGYGDNEKTAELAAAVDALRADMRDESQILIGPIDAPMNGYAAYVYLPDGSKEGWDTSDRHDEWRSRFVELVRSAEWWDVLSLRFGGDEPEHIEAHADAVAQVDLWQ